MSYVIAAWLSCGALLVLYSLRTLRRERALRRLMGNQPEPARRPARQRGAGAPEVLSTEEGPWR